MHRVSVSALLLLASAAAAQGGSAPALFPSFSFTGSFAGYGPASGVLHTDRRRQCSGAHLLLCGRGEWSGTTIPRGGFDPTLSVFDSTGRLVGSNQDGGCGVVAADAVTGMCWDFYLIAALPAGTYRVVLTQSTNTANGPPLQDGFSSFCSPRTRMRGSAPEFYAGSQPRGAAARFLG